MADGCYIMIENGNKLVIFDEQNKKDFVKKLKEQTKQANWKELDDRYDHHCSFQYLGDDATIPEYRVVEEDVVTQASTDGGDTESQPAVEEEKKE